MNKLQCSKVIQRRQKQGKIIKEEFRKLVQACKVCIGKDKAQTELRLAEDVKGNKTCRGSS